MASAVAVLSLPASILPMPLERISVQGKRLSAAATAAAIYPDCLIVAPAGKPEPSRRDGRAAISRPRVEVIQLKVK